MERPVKMRKPVYLSFCNSLTGIFLVIVLLTISLSSYTQVGFMTGVNVTGIRDNYVNNDGPVIGFHFGPSFTSRPFEAAPKLMFENELLISFKGYHQHLDREYQMRFGYFCGSLLLKYRPVEFFSFKAGVELDVLIFSNRDKWEKRYSKFDAGLVFAVHFFENQPVSFYIRNSYGLIPMVNYYDIDKEGNFHSRIHDMRNMCFSLGMKINFMHEGTVTYH